MTTTAIPTPMRVNSTRCPSSARLDGWGVSHGVRGKGQEAARAPAWKRLTAPIVNAVILPLLFLSGVFIPLGNNAPSWMLWVGRIFPVKHFLSGMQAAFLGAPFNWTDVLVAAVWGWEDCSSRSASSAGNRGQANLAVACAGLAPVSY